MRSLIRDHFGMQAEPWKDMFEKERGYSSSVNLFGARAENYSLHKAVVDHDHARVKTSR